MTEIPTPRTDAYVRQHFSFGPPAHVDFARQLERENAVMREALARVRAQSDGPVSEDLAANALYDVDEMRRAFEEGK